jgi:hypothetical protein
LIADSPSSPEEINSHIFAFVFTFLILITAWLIYTSQMSVLPLETRTVTFLNVILLLLVAVVPYLLNSVELVNPKLSSTESSVIRNYSSTLFALDLASILIILASFAQILASEEKKLVAPDLIGQLRGGRNRLLLLAALMGVSAAPQFWSWTLFEMPLRLYVWYIPLITYWGVRAIGGRTRADSTKRVGISKNPLVQVLP